LLKLIKHSTPEEKAYMLRTKARNLHSKQQLAAGEDILFEGLRELGVHLKSKYSQEEVEECHRVIRTKMLDFGLNNIRQLQVAPASDTLSNLRNTLLSEVFIFAYFRDQRVARMIAYEGISLALQNGHLSAHNGMAFICFASAALAQGDFSFGTQVGRLALELSLRLSTTLDKG
jgi:hypothetical protein